METRRFVELTPEIEESLNLMEQMTQVSENPETATDTMRYTLANIPSINLCFSIGVVANTLTETVGALKKHHPEIYDQVATIVYDEEEVSLATVMRGVKMLTDMFYPENTQIVEEKSEVNPEEL